MRLPSIRTDSRVPTTQECVRFWRAAVQPGMRVELPARTFWTFLRELSSRRRTPRILLEELSGLSERPMIIRMTMASRPQQRYDHRLRHLVQRTGDLTIAMDLGIPRSTTGTKFA